MWITALCHCDQDWFPWPGRPEKEGAVGGLLSTIISVTIPSVSFFLSSYYLLQLAATVFSTLNEIFFFYFPFFLSNPAQHYRGEWSSAPPFIPFSNMHISLSLLLPHLDIRSHHTVKDGANFFLLSLVMNWRGD
jgi:hypothetical protein